MLTDMAPTVGQFYGTPIQANLAPLIQKSVSI